MSSRACANAQTPSGDNARVSWLEVQNIGWPIRIKELHNRMNVLEVNEKVDYLKPFIRSIRLGCSRGLFVKLCLPILPYKTEEWCLDFSPVMKHYPLLI